MQIGRKHELSFIFLNVDIVFNMKGVCMKLCAYVLKTNLQGKVSNSSDIGCSFYLYPKYK